MSIWYLIKEMIKQILKGYLLGIKETIKYYRNPIGYLKEFWKEMKGT